jgi:hypothetical protein
MECCRGVEGRKVGGMEETCIKRGFGRQKMLFVAGQSIVGVGERRATLGSRELLGFSKRKVKEGRREMGKTIDENSSRVVFV